MSQLKNSESARLNAVKRELSITLKVLDGELETLVDCMKDDGCTNIFDDFDINTKKLMYSIETTKVYLEDLRRDMNEEVYIWNTKEVCDYIYEHLDYKSIKNSIVYNEIDLLEDLFQTTKFQDIDLVRFQIIQDIVWSLEHKTMLTERDIKFMIDNGYIQDDKVVDMLVNLPKVENNKSTRIAVCTVERPDETVFEVEREVDSNTPLSKVRDELQKEYGSPYFTHYNDDGTATKCIKEDAYYVFSCKWKDSRYRFVNRKRRNNKLERKEVK